MFLRVVTPSVVDDLPDLPLNNPSAEETMFLLFIYFYFYFYLFLFHQSILTNPKTIYDEAMMMMNLFLAIVVGVNQSKSENNRILAGFFKGICRSCCVVFRC